MKLSSPESRDDATQLSRALVLVLVALVAACVLRFPSREVKTMHVDETTQALKLREMIDGEYRYDPKDHHGPTLLYSTIPVMWMEGVPWDDATESLLRLVPALYGVGVILLLTLAGDGISRMALGWSALFIAVSPAMVFYSRYYIMEMLLVFFTFACIACGWRFWITRRIAWLVWAGVAAGLMHATKETCVLHFAAMGLAVFFVYIAEFFSAGAGLGVVNRNRKAPVTWRQLLIFAGVAAVTSIVLFSQFFTKWSGVWDSVATYVNMLGRADGQGHEKPFGYYFKLLWGGLISGREWGGPGSPGWEDWKSVLCLTADPRRAIFTEAVLMVLALIGCIAAFTATAARNQSNHFMRFLAVYSAGTFLIYSFIAYKTPWCVLGAWHGLLIMAGIGADRVVRMFWVPRWRRVAVVVLLVASVHLGLQAWRATRDFARESRNPYNYSMTSTDVLDWVDKLEHFAELHPDGHNMRIDQNDIQGGFPLPWYLARRFPNYRWQSASMDPNEAAVMFFSPEADDQFRAALQALPGQEAIFNEAHMPGQITLYSGGNLRVYVKKPLWDQYVARQPWEPVAVQQ